MNEIDTKNLSDKITVENVKIQIADGWTNPFFIAEYIVGIDNWKNLPEWDKKILMYKVHKVMVDNKLL